MNNITVKQAEENIKAILYALKDGQIDVVNAFVKLNLYYDHINIHKVAMMERRRVKRTNINCSTHLTVKR